MTDRARSPLPEGYQFGDAGETLPSQAEPTVGEPIIAKHRHTQMRRDAGDSRTWRCVECGEVIR